MKEKFITKALTHSVHFHDKIKNATRLVHDYFETEALGYQRIDNKGNFIGLTDTPELAHYCLEHKFHINSPYLRHPDNFHSGLIINAQAVHFADHPAVVKLAGTSFDMSKTVALIKKDQSDSVELLFLIGKPANQALCGLSWNHQILLDKYLNYFKEELSSCLRTCEHDSISLPAYMPENYHRFEPFLCQIPIALQYKFLKAIGQQELVSKATLLSAREKECLHLIVRGKTAKESAAGLCLSARTVEYYLENIKNKFGCTHKADLFNYAQIFLELKLL